MTEPRKKPEKKPRRPARTGEALNVWLTQEVSQALQAYLEGTFPRVAKTAAVEAALREFLRARGFLKADQAKGTGQAEEG